MAVTAAGLHSGVLSALRGIPNVTVYDGDVDGAPPAEYPGGPVLPYLVLWSGAGTRPVHALSADAGPELDWRCQVTAAAGVQEWAVQAAGLARTALDCVRPVQGSGALIEQTGTPGVILDRDVKPARFFVPLKFRCYTA